MLETGWPEWELSSHYTTTSARYQKVRESSVILANNKPAIESQYVKKHLGKILPACIAEICEKRPLDPIEYMAQWIYKHRENELHQKKVSVLWWIPSWVNLEPYY